MEPKFASNTTATGKSVLVSAIHDDDLGKSKVTAAFLARLLCAAAGVIAVCGLWHYVNVLIAAFTGVISYVAGGMLFLTVVGAFYYIFALFCVIRANAQFRFSVSEVYTALAVVTVMGYFATACLHAFQADNLALEHWNSGTIAAILFTSAFGIGSFVKVLWDEGSR